MINYIVLIFLKSEFLIKPVSESNGLFKLGDNALALGEEADFEALNCQPSTKVDTR
ncbi:hypothetical protein BH10BAC2_BH10BAC2_10960 [soil metagenome]